MSTARSQDGKGAHTGSDYEHLSSLLATMARLEPGNARRAVLRDILVIGYRPLAEHIAARFRHRGVPIEDLTQVATVGLIHAIDRFEPERGNDFLCFAVPTIMGEVRRYFRDTCWSTRMPRRLQELHLQLVAATNALVQRLGSAPTPRQLASYLDLDIECVWEGLAATSSYRARSLDTISSPDEPPIGETLGADDPALDAVDYHESLRILIDELPERQRTIVIRYFFADQTQTQIAERLGISQMHVSRLLHTALSHLRHGLFEDAASDKSA